MLSEITAFAGRETLWNTINAVALNSQFSNAQEDVNLVLSGAPDHIPVV